PPSSTRPTLHNHSTSASEHAPDPHQPASKPLQGRARPDQGEPCPVRREIGCQNARFSYVVSVGLHSPRAPSRRDRSCFAHILRGTVKQRGRAKRRPRRIVNPPG